MLTTVSAPSKTRWKSLTKISSNSIKLKWKKVKNTSGYEIEMKKGKKGKYKRIKDIKKNNAVTYKKAKLKIGTYFFKIRAYKKADDGRKVYGSYSKVKSIKIFFLL